MNTATSASARPPTSGVAIASLVCALLCVGLEGYYAEHGRYGSLEESGVAPRAEPPRYQYELVEKAERHFVVRATGQGEMAGDVWEVNSSGELRNVASGCL